MLLVHLHMDFYHIRRHLQLGHIIKHVGWLVCDVFGEFHAWAGLLTINTLFYLIERDYGCVFAYVSGLLIYIQSFVVFCCYRKDSSSLPVSHNALLPLSGCARGRALLGCGILPYLLLLYLLSLCIVYLSSFHSPVLF